MPKMHWIPKGQIFKCAEHLPEQFISHAQSPQIILLNDRIRVYFSTRKQDDTGKFKSHVSYADYDFEWDLKDVAHHEVIPLGDLGTFDEHGIFPFSPFVDDDGRITAYTCGWSRRVSVDVETATGFAVSQDGGQTFQKLGKGQIFGQTLYEPMLVGDSFVRHYNGQYHMWYMVGQRWVREHDKAKPDRVYKIAHAVSDDGMEWHPDNRCIIPDILHENECQALPSVIHHNGIYHMVFCYRDVHGFRDDPSKGYRIGYAWSVDLQNWVRDDGLGNIQSQGECDKSMMAYPHLCAVKGKIYCLYNGNHFGKDGLGLLELDTSGLQWGHNQSSMQDIVQHLKLCHESFVNDLNSRVNINDYASKLADKAERFEIGDRGDLIGLLAAYENDDFIYITDVSVIKSFEGQGLGRELMDRVIAFSNNKDIHLEVHKDNVKAINLYKKYSFHEENVAADYLKMVRKSS